MRNMDKRLILDAHKWICAVLVLPMMMLLAGCQTIPLSEAGNTAFSLPSPDKAIVRITEFKLPKEEPGARLLHLMVLLGGGQVQYPVGASVFDATDDLRYVGTLSMRGVALSRGNVPWLEYETKPGHTTLMLVEAPPRNEIVLKSGAPFRQVDFMEINLAPGEIRHIAVTREGALLKPYLGEIALPEADRKHCESLSESDSESSEQWKSRVSQIDAYMRERGIDAETRDFKVFCHLLSAPKQILRPTAGAMTQFAEYREDIEATRAEHHEKWKRDHSVRDPYDLMRSYRPIQEESGFKN